MTLSRRTLLLGATALAAGAAAAGHGLVPALAAPGPTLRLGSRVIEVNGRAATVMAIEGPAGDGLRLAPGAPFRARLRNALDQETLIHWHGQTPPQDQDGVAGIPLPSLQPGEQRDYAFTPRAGTHWMHSHVGLSVQSLLAAPLIVADELTGFDTEHVLLLQDFTFRDPEEIFAELTGPMDDHAMMHGVHLNDVAYDAFLANHRTLADPEVLRLAPGSRLRLRLINAAASSSFVIDSGALPLEVVALDGTPVVPRTIDLVPITPGQRVDLRLTLPKAGGSFPILARREGETARTGLILATPGAAIGRVAAQADAAAPAADNRLERLLRAARPLAAATPVHRLTGDLGGNHMGYHWSIALNGARGPIRSGERVELTLVNGGGMPHPIHLHGHHFAVIGLGGETRPDAALRDTVLVPPGGGRVTVAFDAGRPGRWMLHCHQLYHHHAGMMGFVTVEA